MIYIAIQLGPDQEAVRFTVEEAKALQKALNELFAEKQRRQRRALNEHNQDSTK